MKLNALNQIESSNHEPIIYLLNEIMLMVIGIELGVENVIYSSCVFGFLVLLVFGFWYSPNDTGTV